MAKEYVIGVDVGTGSVRVGVFDLQGNMDSYAEKKIKLWYPRENFVEQSSADIWSATCVSVKEALGKKKIDPQAVTGVSFDATCSLVALDSNGEPVTVSPTGETEQNIIVWMDHRAIREAERINSRGHAVLKYVGGRISPEMEPPKLLWLKENLPHTWRAAGKFMDLADFLTFKATGTDVRSLCTTVCKWTYLGQENRWDKSFFEQIGLEDLFTDNKIGENILPMGTLIGSLSQRSAEELGLTPRTKVAVGIIDAHAGGLGLIGLDWTSAPAEEELEKVLSLIGGTSSCHMAVSRKPLFIPGIWGPYFSAMIPGMWLTEGGQSATGSLVDFMIMDNSKYEWIWKQAEEQKITVYQYLNDVIDQIKRAENKGPEIVKDLNVLPYFLGNRSPHADPTARGVISGLTLDESVQTVARKYYATVQAVAYGTRHIIEEMNRHGYKIRKIHACGGGTRNRVWLQEHADITGCEIVLPRESEAVILGSAILAAVGAGHYGSILEAAVAMSSAGEKYTPRTEYRKFHKAKYKVFRKMYQHFNEYKKALARF
ncbi:MAG TPA: FGGY-family carbohydrate kinase [archaeon]|nr:FGGY-family carbohydrate kinase [archaeon]